MAAAVRRRAAGELRAGGSLFHDPSRLPDRLHDARGGRDPAALGGRVLFHIPLEVGYRWDGHNSVSAYFDHMSNGYTNRFNEGMDRVGIRYGYRF